MSGDDAFSITDLLAERHPGFTCSRRNLVVRRSPAGLYYSKRGWEGGAYGVIIVGTVPLATASAALVNTTVQTAGAGAISATVPVGCGHGQGSISSSVAGDEQPSWLPVRHLAGVLPDGGRLATGLQDGTILIWNLEPKTWHAGGKPKDLDRRDLERMWTELAGEDAIEAHRTVWSLATAPEKAVPFLKEHLRPVPALDNTQVQRWIADLDSDAFAVREEARRRLQEMGDVAHARLRQALQEKPSLELRRNIEMLLSSPRRMSPEELRQIRAITVLEQIGDAAARRVLQRLTEGAAEARQTREAKAALQRLKQGSPR